MNTLPLSQFLQHQYPDSHFLTINRTMQDQSGRTLYAQEIFRMIKAQQPQLPQNLPNLDLRFLLNLIPENLRERAMQPLPQQTIAVPMGFMILIPENMEDNKQNNGASEEQIQRIPVQEITKDNFHQFQTDCCSICQESFQEGQKAQILNCKHAFHQNCLTNWIKINAICPLCRASAIQSNF